MADDSKNDARVVLGLVAICAALVGGAGGNLLGQQQTPDRKVYEDIGEFRAEIRNLGSRVDASATSISETAGRIGAAVDRITMEITTVNAAYAQLDIRVSRIEEVNRNRFGDDTKTGTIDAAVAELQSRLDALEGR